MIIFEVIEDETQKLAQSKSKVINLLLCERLQCESLAHFGEAEEM
jgi:hypothetical protein